MLSVAAFLEGRNAQAFPSFGSERMGAPVVAFCRIDDQRDPAARADHGARRADHPGPDPAAPGGRVRRPRRSDGYILINTTRSFEELGLGEFVAGLPRTSGCCTVPATELALKHVGRPLPNAALLGGFAAVSGHDLARVGGRGDPREVLRQGRRRPTSPRPREAYDFVQPRSARRPPMLKQIEGSRGGRRGRGAVPPAR
ncbi:MAG: 2-oxoacid:acceptor oxidoreductase family protein [Comamonadaceae bacterium]|nr:2-oxoacid:acceptor oxidoreductase family protein [Comamonadaceae bacterium]